MSENAPYAAAAIDDLPPKWDGFAFLVRAGLGITAFGAQVMNVPPDYTTTSHDESDSGQQELYVGLKGTGWVVVNENTDSEERLVIDEGYAVRVDAGVSRVLVGGPEGVRILCIGSTPGQPYEVQEWTEPE
jgi:uncharacterized cupin superfamily protein